MPDSMLPQQRFTHLVDDYRRFRPDYPAALIDHLRRVVPPQSGTAIADLGSGTGIFTRQLIEAGYPRVCAVEPNTSMRAAAEAELGGHHAFVSVSGDAEATTLATTSVDLVTAAQAFHWFDPKGCLAECRRILKSGGRVALIWNNRESVSGPFTDEYEAILRRYTKDPEALDHRGRGEAKMRDFWVDGTPAPAEFPHRQLLDRAALHGRTASASYSPKSGEPGHAEQQRALDNLFDNHQRDGVVVMEYMCRLYMDAI